MNKTVEIDIASLNNDEAIDLDFDISTLLIDFNLRHTVASLGSVLVIMIEGIDIILYNKFISFLKNKNLLFKEV